MNDLNEMWSICHDCPYWEVCDSPYNCTVTELKLQQEQISNKES